MRDPFPLPPRKKFSKSVFVQGGIKLQVDIIKNNDNNNNFSCKRELIITNFKIHYKLQFTFYSDITSVK